MIWERISILISSSKKGIVSENENVQQKTNSLFIYFSGSIPNADAEEQAGWAACSALHRVWGEGEGTNRTEDTALGRANLCSRDN